MDSEDVRRKRGRPLTDELRRAYYQHMPPGLQEQWALLEPEEQDAVLKILEEYHQATEQELWSLVSGLLEVLVKKK
jgi:hypothetical protein